MYQLVLAGDSVGVKVSPAHNEVHALVERTALRQSVSQSWRTLQVVLVLEGKDWCSKRVKSVGLFCSAVPRPQVHHMLATGDTPVLLVDS